MPSPNHNGALTAEDYLSIFRIVFSKELHAIIFSVDHKSDLAELSRADKRKIEENHAEIAEAAANYFIENNGSNLEDEKAVDKLIKKSILKALRDFE